MCSRKRVVTTFFLVVATGCAAEYSGSPDSPEEKLVRTISEKVKAPPGSTHASIVGIYFSDSKGRTGICSGFLYKSNVVISADHCILTDNPDAIVVAFPNANGQVLDVTGDPWRIRQLPDVEYVGISRSEAITKPRNWSFSDIRLLRLKKRMKHRLIPIASMQSKSTVRMFGYGGTTTLLCNLSPLAVLDRSRHRHEMGQLRRAKISQFNRHVFGANCKGDSGGPTLNDRDEALTVTSGSVTAKVAGVGLHFSFNADLVRFRQRIDSIVESW